MAIFSSFEICLIAEENDWYINRPISLIRFSSRREKTLYFLLIVAFGCWTNKMTFSFHSVSDQRAESVNAGKSEGKETIPQAIPSIFQGDAPKWEEGILRLYRECWGRKGRERTQDPEWSRVHSYDGQAHQGHPVDGGDKMHACCSHMSVTSVTGRD